ncbi:MAG: 3-oxoacyl-[acyl-carrier-protein] reductase [Armatimonadetes bacterium]|nr:3-oxoacyl-[acyl-carrier-protein] reductase [Armatimonadota bacterium]
MTDLTGKVAVVTGAGRSIGRAIAEHLAALGCRVVVNNLNAERNAEVVAAIGAAGGEAVGVIGDVTDPAVADACVKAATEQFGRLDIVVNNAGVARDGLIARMSDEQWHAVIETNLTGAFNLIRAATRVLMRQRSGRIINISSVVGKVGNAGQANYAASKAGLLGLTKAVARELGSRGVTVNAVAPGFIDEGMTEGLEPELRETLQQQIPLGRLGTAADVAATVAFLASDAAGYVTGQTLSVDGGMSMQ